MVSGRIEARDLELSIAALFRDRCFECHSHQAESAKGGLVLDSRNGWESGGHSGTAVVPGNLEGSLLWERLTHTDPGEAMPPEGRLSADELEVFRQWILNGAPDDRTVAAGPILQPGRVSASELWSFQQPRPDSGASIDSLLEESFAESSIRPADAASRETLIRRLFLDLTGLPPKPEEVEVFSERPWAEVVDAVLDSPHFGEHWARHWLDLARYAESNGLDRDMSYNEAWKYRQWVVEAFQADMPFDQFVREQIAGDLLPSSSSDVRRRQLVATGFLALGPKPLQMGKIVDIETADEVLETVGKAFLGQSITCARCHDHKFDPISQKDYFALSGIFQSTQFLFGYQAEARELREPFLDELLHQVSSESLVSRNRDFQAQYAAIHRLWEEGEDEEKETWQSELDVLRKDAPPVLDEVIGVRDREQVFHAQFLEGGDPERKGERVPRGFLSSVVFFDAPSVNTQQSGRLDLANWIAHPENPLTARVAVNRIWKHLFGRGIVESVDNFGATGTGPSHPKLLDALAVRFVENGWSQKALIREILLSEAYQRSSSVSREQLAEAEEDPENRTFWRMSVKSLTGEAIRDSLLSVSGRLDRTPHFRSPMQDLGWVSFSGNNQTGDPAPILKEFRTATYRSVYLPVLRSLQPEFFRVFRVPSPDFSQGNRDEVISPEQSLFLMNSPLVADCAASLSREVAVGDVDSVWLRVLSRKPTIEERNESLFALEALQAVDAQTAWQTWVHGMFLHPDFREIR